MARRLLQNHFLQWAIAIFKPTRFFTESTRILHNQVSFFTELIQFLFRTNSITLQNRLNSLNRTAWFFLRNQLDLFTEPTWFFTDQVGFLS